ncbi:MliC family protein, partial [Marinobacter sp.]|uniref:MliC family protein n=1 Tax=Marinobacter sp. TaxID=50741 RepID=UPI0019E5D5A7
MFMRRVLPLSVVASIGLGLAACASNPQTAGLSEYDSYRCGQLDVRITGSEGSDLVGLEYLNRRVLLKPAVAASGALYVAPGDPDTRFWGKGERGTLTLRGQTYPECLEPGAIETSFRAIGT